MTRTRQYKDFTLYYHPNGLTISTISILDGQCLHQLYQGYTLRKAVAIFREYVREYNESIICEEV